MPKLNIDGSLEEKLDDLKFEPVGRGIRQVIYSFSCGSEVKGCGKCKSWLPLERFSRDRKSSTGYGHWCRDCANSNTKRHYDRRKQNPDWIDSRREKERVSTRAAKRMAVEYMGNICHDCGKVYPDYIYDFHHLSGGKKVDNPSAILKREWFVAKEELDKCVMVCANCHRERHYG